LAANNHLLADGLKGFLNERKVRTLIFANRRELLDGDVGIRKASFSEVGRLEYGESLRVELGLELFKDTSELEH